MGKDKNVCLENRSLNYFQEAHKYFFFSWKYGVS